MKSFAELYKKLNYYVFDWIISKKAVQILAVIYFAVLAGGLFHFGPLSQVRNNNDELQMNLICYIAALCFVTVAAYRAFLQFTKYVADIIREAEGVKLSESDMEKVRKWAYNAIQRYTSVLVVLVSVGVAFVFVRNTKLDLRAVDFLEMYAGVLIFFAALSTILAYATLIFDISAIQTVYNSTFHKYAHSCPVSTKIFREYNKIITRGLIRFWCVGSCVLFLTFIVVEHKDPMFIVVVALAIMGFILFTFYPFCGTKRKIIELKMEAIELLDAENIQTNQNTQSRESLIKLILESPSQISTNYYTLYWSTLLAIISTLVSLKDMLPHFF